MTGLDLHHEGERAPEGRTRFPLYVTVEVAVIVLLGVLLYGLFRML